MSEYGHRVRGPVNQQYEQTNMKHTSTDHDWERIVPNELDASDRHRLLANERRQTIIAALGDVYGISETTLGELASDVERWERVRTDSDVPKADVLGSLHHVHLPLLDELGVVEYDPESKRIVIDRAAPPTEAASKASN